MGTRRREIPRHVLSRLINSIGNHMVLLWILLNCGILCKALSSNSRTRQTHQLEKPNVFMFSILPWNRHFLSFFKLAMAPVSPVLDRAKWIAIVQHKLIGTHLLANRGKSWPIYETWSNFVQIAEWLVQQKIALIELSTVYQIVHQFRGMFLWPVHNATLNMHSSIHPANLELHHLWCSIRCVDEGVGCKIYNYLMVEFTVCTGDTLYIDACMIYDVRYLLQ